MAKNSSPRIYSDYDLPPSPCVDCSEDVPLTKQSFKDSCDIQSIMRNSVVGGAVTVNAAPPMQGDFTDALDFQAAQEILIKARKQFDDLPSRIRERFGNDPVKFLAFVNDEKNTDEAVALGIATARPKVDLPKPEGEKK